ncbi:MAG: MlaD family protein [Steroidobacteraceae bacterium]
MSDRETDARRDSSSRPPRAQAGVRRGWWPGWIWAIPIATLIVVAWLGARALVSGGERITITFSDAHGIKKNNTAVEYRGTQIGKVTDVELSKSGDAVTVTASIDASARRFLRQGTRFWLRGAHPSLSDLSSLGALLSGPTLVLQPGPGKAATHFEGLARKPVSPVAAHPLYYEVSLKGDVGTLAKGDPVELRGFTVGEIGYVGFSYDPRMGDLAAPTTLAIYPKLFHIETRSDRPDAAAVRAAIATLIGKGLRARLERDPPLVGSYRVSLEMVPGAPAVAPAVVGGLPQIPVAPGGGLSSVANRLEKVPIEQIAQNALDITRRLDTLVSSPRLRDALVQLSQAMRQIHRVTAKSGPQVTALIATLRKAADDLDGTTRAMRQVVSGTATQGGLEGSLQEIKDAARAVRSLANYLDRHPEALIEGRGRRR